MELTLPDMTNALTLSVQQAKKLFNICIQKLPKCI